MSNIIPFDFNSHEIRVIQDDNNEPWFVAKDISDILGYTDAHKMTSKLDDDEKSNRQIGGLGSHTGGRGTTLINESGLYSVILTSKKSEAKKFKKWITSEVLPSIRKTGGYQVNAVPQTLSEALRLAADLEDQKLLAQSERDEAIRTKAEIGSKREASAMAKASVETRRANKLQEQLGVSEEWKQTKAIPWLPEVFDLSRVAYQQIGKKLSALSKSLDINPKEIEDTNFGTVKAYHVDVINKFYEQLMSEVALLSKYRKRKEVA